MAESRGQKQLARWVNKQGRGGKAQLAAATGKRWATIHDIVEGRSVPTVPTAKAIGRVTGIPWESLV